MLPKSRPLIRHAFIRKTAFRAGLSVALLFALSFAPFLLASEISTVPDKAWFMNNYAKSEYHLAMRDGVTLYTAVYSPKDESSNYPIWMVRTPYGAGPTGTNFSGPVDPMKYFAREKFIFVFQDVRGRYASEGEFEQIRPLKSASAGTNESDESTDTWDTIDWLVKHLPNNNGKVGLSGTSYPGFYAACGAVNSHPALKAVSPQAPIGDWFIGDDYHINGALLLAKSYDAKLNQMLAKSSTQKGKPITYSTHDSYQFYLNIGPLANADPRSADGTAGFWDDLIKHGNYDEFWQARDARPHLTNVNCAVLMVGGWFDAEDLYGALTVYHQITAQNPSTRNILAMGPWRHGGWGAEDAQKFGLIDFGSNTSEYFREHIELPFFKHYLKGTTDDDLPGAVVFQTGANQWRQFSSWPPTNGLVKTLYFQNNGKLAFTPPADTSTAFDEYVSDPAKPVPFTTKVSLGTHAEYMIEDQRLASRRPDVLVYQTEVLEENVTLAGPVVSDLKVSTSGTDSDWIVKLIDVYPGESKDINSKFEGNELDGYQQLVRGGVMRGKFRNSLEKPEPFTPGEMTKVEWQMPDVFHTFRRGHRIMVQVQSTWFPLIDRNPQFFCDIYQAQPGDFKKATQRIFRSASGASGVRINVLPERQ